jgi:hypothetical protein
MRYKQMTITSVLLLVFVCAGAALAQSPAGLTSGKPSPTPATEPVDASYVPPVSSKAPALEVVSVVRKDPFVRIRIKNVSDKSIYCFRMAYYKDGQSTLYDFIHADEKTSLAPGEIFKIDYPFLSSSAFVREPLTFQAVLFEDGTGDGEADKVKGLQDLFLASRKELEHVIAVLQAGLAAPEVETGAGLSALLSKLSEVPQYIYSLDMKGLAGLSLPMWRETAMGMIRDIQQEKYRDPAVSIRDRLQNLKDRFYKTLAKYPRVA